MPNDNSAEEVRAAVRERYGSIARERVGNRGSCCGTNSPVSCCADGGDSAVLLGYSAQDIAAVPDGADLGLGCGTPLSDAALQPGETVLDLGSGAGFDCFLAAVSVSARSSIYLWLMQRWT